MPESTACTRRSFLKAAAAGAAAPYIVSSAALGRGLWKSPNDRIAVAFIGVGNMGHAHLGGFLSDPQIQLVAICDVDAGKRAGAAEIVEKHYADQRARGSYRGCAQLNEYERVLERPDIDAVMIAVPDHWHEIIAVAAMQAGKDVYCEKPLSLTVREAWRMVEAARRYGRVFQTGSQQRSEANFRQACEWVRSGRIGRLLTVHVGVAGPSQEAYLPEEPVPAGLDWDRWLGPAPWQPYNRIRCSGDYGGGWRNIRDYSGGMMTDWGAHHFDIAQWGMGMDGSGPVEIIPPPRVPGVRESVDPAKEQTLTFRYASGVTMIHGGANGILFTGTDGKIEVNRGYLRTWPEEIARTPLAASEVHLYESPGHRQDWIECIRTRRRPICDVEIGASSVTVCHLGNIAFWTGRTIRWDPVRREILGDPEAARWLDREKRAPWSL